jgi:hypothetical protein
MATAPVIPRGNPLTEAMDFTSRDGCPWVAYVEGYSATRPWRLLPQTVLPGRRLRFDSATESRISPTRPAGSPFLDERRLIALLAASPLLETELPPPAPTGKERCQAQLERVWKRFLRHARPLGDALHLVGHALAHGRWARP